MARNAPQITVKDLTNAMKIQDQKTRLEIATQSGGNRLEDMTGYGSDWPGTMKDQGFGNQPGTDPDEVHEQLTIPGLEVRGLQINPQVAHSPSGTYDEYGRPLNQEPWKGLDPGGNLIDIEHLKEGYQKEHKGREQLHDWKYHDGANPNQLMISQTRKDKAIRNIINTYGKDGQGNYKDPSKLLSNLLTIAEA